jgi:hypothetical protein
LSIAKPFSAINTKGGESIKPKAKGPHHHYFKFFKKKIISKTLLKAKGRISSEGFYLVKEKAFETREKFEIIFLYLWLFAKEFEKIFPEFCKNKQVVQNVK